MEDIEEVAVSPNQDNEKNTFLNLGAWNRFISPIIEKQPVLGVLIVVGFFLLIPLFISRGEGTPFMLQYVIYGLAVATFLFIIQGASVHLKENKKLRLILGWFFGLLTMFIASLLTLLMTQHLLKIKPDDRLLSGLADIAVAIFVQPSKEMPTLQTDAVNFTNGEHNELVDSPSKSNLAYIDFSNKGAPSVENKTVQTQQKLETLDSHPNPLPNTAGTREFDYNACLEAAKASGDTNAILECVDKH